MPILPSRIPESGPPAPSSLRLKQPSPRTPLPRRSPAPCPLWFGIQNSQAASSSFLVVTKDSQQARTPPHQDLRFQASPNPKLPASPHLSSFYAIATPQWPELGRG